MIVVFRIYVYIYSMIVVFRIYVYIYKSMIVVFQHSYGTV